MNFEGLYGLNSLTGLAEILIIALLLTLLFSAFISLLYFQAKRKRRVEAEKFERILAEIRVEAEKLREELSKIERLGKILEERVLPVVGSMRFEEALRELERLGSQIPLGVKCEVEFYKSELEAVRALKEACKDAVKAWVIEAVRLHLPQTAKNWRNASHSYTRQLDELLAYNMVGVVEANPQNLLEWFKAGNPALYEVLSRLIDSSESLEVFFRMVEKTLEELEYIKIFRVKHGEAYTASRLRAALELEKRKTLDRIEGLSEKLLKA